jgi:curli biogenesis system outer membrane secretion channel CsgG
MKGIFVNQLLNCIFSKTLVFLIFLLSLMSCSVIDQAIHPDEKPSQPSRPTFEQILKEDYKGPKARVLIIKFIDKSIRGKETSQVGDGISEMLSNVLVATNRYIVLVGKSLDDFITGQDIGRPDRFKKEEMLDLLVEGTIKEFKPGIAGAGELEGTSYVTLIVRVINPRTNQELATERIRGRATDFGGTVGKGGVGLPNIFRDFSKTPMEKALRIAIEESASLIVAKTPPESYKIFPPVSQKETPKPAPAPPPETPKVVPPPPPPLRVTQVVWAYVNLREGPGTNFKVIGNAKKGTSLKILEVKGDWLHVRLEDGREAWVSKLATSEVSPSSPSPSPPKPTPM